MPIGTGKLPPRIHLASLGCAKNLVDSERILGRLAAAGAMVGASAEQADIIIVNTCGFIDPAKEESIQTILELAQHKEKARCRKLLVMGCLAQRYAATLREQLAEADGVFGLGDEDAIMQACGMSRTAGRAAGRLLLTPKHTGYLRIADGCDNRCAYCAIPIIRGRFRSRPSKEIVREAVALVRGGVRELNIIAQDTTLYGMDLPKPFPIHSLLERLAESLPQLKWMRLLYTHPAHFTDDLISAYAAISKLCPYVDLPLQHLSDTILKRMGRKVTQSQILSLIERIRAGVPGVAIRTAFIVGFPGETRAQFNDLLQLVKELRFEHMGVFAYSSEEDTRAARMRGHVSERAKGRRLRDLMLAQQKMVLTRNRRAKGTRVPIVIESRSEDSPEVWVARMATQAPDVDSVVYVTGKGLRPGRFVEVEITGSSGYDLKAQAVGTRS